MTTTLRYVPQILKFVAVDGKVYRDVPVVGVIAHPPGQHPEVSCIRPEMIAVEIKTPVGSQWYGTNTAYIDSSLRMVMAVNARDEVLSKWEAVGCEQR